MLNEIRGLIKEGKITEAEKKLAGINVKSSENYWLIDALLKQKQQKWGAAINSYQKVLDINAENNEAKLQIEIINSILKFWNPEMHNP